MRKNLLFLFIFSSLGLCASNAAMISVEKLYQANRNVKALSGDEKKLVGKCLELTDTDSGIDRKNLSQLRRLVDRSKDARAVYARHLRKTEGDAFEALNFAGTGVLPDKTLKNWQKLNSANYDAMLADWTKRKQVAQKNNQALPEKPEKGGIFADFPACTDWDLSDESMSCVMETACALAELGQIKAAFAVCDRIGTAGEGARRLKAHELYADIRALNEEYKEALKCLDAGEAYAKSFKGNYRNTNKELFDATLARYKKKRDEIKRLLSIPNHMKWYLPDMSENGKVLQDFERKINDGAMSEKDFVALRKRSNEESGRYQNYATMLMARCARIAESDPGKALTILIPLVTGKSVADEFVKNYREAYKTAINEYKAAVQKKETPPVHPDETLQKALPDFKTWTITDANACAIPEIARCLSALGKNAEAVEMLLSTRPKLKCAEYVNATEFGGRLLLAQNELKKADDFCKHGLAMIPHLSTARNGKMITDRTGVTDRLKSQMNSLKNAVAYRMEVAKYGEGFVRYRDAETQRLEKKDFVRAYEGYLRVKTVDSGVYSEAANAYLVKCYLHFATDEGKSELDKYIGERARVINAKLESLKQLKKARLLDGFNKILEKSIAQNQQNLTRLKNIPSGNMALKAAMGLTEKALSENEFGLYRGEMLTDIGLFHADENCDFKTAETWLTRADQWFEKAEKADANLEKFAILGDAAGVTAPPPAPRYKDMFGNILPAEIKPGMIFNRQNSDWYVMDRRKQIVLYLGLFAFADNKRDLASSHWEKLGQFDPYLTQYETTVYSRLKYILWKNDKSLYTPDEMFAFFKGKARNALLLADVNFQFEAWRKSLLLYSRISNGKYGAIDKKQRNMLIYGIGDAITQIDGSISGADYLENQLASIDDMSIKASTMLRIIQLTLPNTGKMNEVENFQRIKPKIERILKTCPNTSEAEDALYLLGWLGIESDGSYGIEVLTEYLKKYPKGKHCDEIKQILQNIK